MHFDIDVEIIVLYRNDTQVVVYYAEEFLLSTVQSC